MKNEIHHKKMTVINGSHFSDLEGFYEEISQLFMKDEDWKVGTLDGTELKQISLGKILKSQKKI